MTNAQFSNYLGMKPSEIRKIFEDIREGFEEVSLSSDIGMDIANLYAYGSTPPNYQSYLQRLDVARLIREQGGFLGQEAEMIVKSKFYDPWVMLQSACLYVLDKRIPKEFQTLVLDPADKRLDLIRDSKKQRDEALDEAKKVIDGLTKPMLKASEAFSSLEPWKLAGSHQESVMIEINKILFKAGAIDEYGRTK